MEKNTGSTFQSSLFEMLRLLHVKCNSSTLCYASATFFVLTDTDLTSCEKLQIALDWPGFLMHVPDLSHSMGGYFSIDCSAGRTEGFWKVLTPCLMPLYNLHHRTVIGENVMAVRWYFATTTKRTVDLMSVWPCIVDDMYRENPTRCYRMVYWTYNPLKMFRTLLCPSSGARDHTGDYSMWHITLCLKLVV